jgi:hypothetical protein
MYYPWSNVETTDDKKCITMTAKKEATWEQMEAWLMMSFGKDKSVEWSGFGEIGKEFMVAVIRKGKTADDSDSESDSESECDSDDERECDDGECGECSRCHCRRCGAKDCTPETCGMTNCDNDKCTGGDFNEKYGVHSDDGFFCSDECAAVAAVETN